MDTVAQVTLCTVKTCFIEYSSPFFPAETAGFISVVSYDSDSSPTLRVTEFKVHSGLAKCSGKEGSRSMCSGMVDTAELYRIVWCLIASINGADSCTSFPSHETNVVPWWDRATVQKFCRLAELLVPEVRVSWKFELVDVRLQQHNWQVLLSSFLLLCHRSTVRWLSAHASAGKLYMSSYCPI